MLSHRNMANLSISQQLNIVMFIICLFKCFEASFSISLSVQTNTVENHLLDSLAIRDYLSTNSVIATNNANNSDTTPYSKLTKLSLIDEYDDTLQDSQESSLLLSNPTLLNQSKLNQLRQLYQQSSANAYQTEQIFYTFAYSLIIVSSFLGNLLVCKVCLKNMTKTNALILSLAASDLAMTIFNIPFNYFRLHNYSWPFGSVMCFLVNFVQHLVVYNSSYTMAIIAIQRYYSVCWIVFPFQQKSQSAQRIFSQPNRKYSSQLCSMRTIYVSIFITWSFSILISTLFTFTSTTVTRKDIFSSIVAMYIAKQQQQHNKQSHWNSTYHSSNYHHLDDFPTVVRCTNPVPDSVEQYFHKNVSIKADFAKSIVVFVTQYFIPLSISCCLYIRIGKTISRQGKLASIRGNPKAQIRQRKKRRRIIMLVLVVAVFALCWLPLHAFHLFTDAGLVNYNYQVFMMVHWIAMSSVCYNPFIYCWLNKHFRKAAIRIFCVCRNAKSEKYSVKTIVTNRTDILDISEVNNTNLQIFESIKPANESPLARPLEQLLKPSNSSSKPCPVISTAICITNGTSIGNSNHDSDKLVLTTHL